MLFLFGTIVLSILTSTAFGQDYTIYPKSISKCPVVKDNDEINVEIRLKDEVDGSKSLSLTADLNVILDDECTYEIRIERKTDGEFVKYITGHGGICESINNNPAWNRFKLEIDPPVKGCTFNSSTYSLSGFQVNKEEVSIPIPFEDGHFRTYLHMFCNEKDIACIVGEVEIVGDED